jgi:hypothetical protein
VTGSYHRLFEIEKSFRMSKSDLQARPVYHRKRDSIEAHLTIVFAALAISRWIEARTGWSIRKFVKTARRYRTIQIQAGQHVITAADPLPDDLRQATDAINRIGWCHGRTSSSRFVHAVGSTDLDHEDLVRLGAGDELAQRRYGFTNCFPQFVII